MACSDNHDETSTAAGTGGSGGVGIGGGGSSSSSTGGVPSISGIEIVFPPPASLTDEPTITVHGTVATPTDVQSLSIAGAMASSRDGFATWTVEVPLALGDQTLIVDVVDSGGMNAQSTSTVEVRRETPLMVNHAALGVDALNGRAFYFLDPPPGSAEMIGEADLTSGARRVVSDANVGSGPTFNEQIEQIAWDEYGQRILAIDADELWAIDPTSGDRSILASAGTGSGAWPTLIGGIAVDTDANRLLVSDNSGVEAIRAIDLDTGNRSVVSDPTIGAGLDLDSPHGLAVDAAANRALVHDWYWGVLAVDLSNGNRTWLSGGSVGSGPALFIGPCLSHDPVSARVWVMGAGGVMSVDLSNGDRSVVSSPSMGSGPPWGSPFGCGFDGTRLILGDPYLDAVVAVATDTGDRSFVSSFTIGAGPNVLQPYLLDWDEVSDRFITTELTGSTILAADRDDGDRTVISSATVGTGPLIGAPTDLDAVGGAIFVSRVVTPHVMRIDMQSGDREGVSGDTQGSGPAFQGAIAVAASDAQATDLWVLDGNPSRVIAIDGATGDRTIVSDETIGTGPPIGLGDDLVIDGSRLLVLAWNTIFDVDPATGNRVELSGPNVGTGLMLGGGQAALDGNGNLIVGTLIRVHAVDLATGDRTILTDVSSPMSKGWLEFMTGMTMDGAGIPWVVDQHVGALIAIDRVTGDRVIVSK